MNNLWFKLRNSRAFNLVRGLVPNWIVNKALHLPKALFSNLIYGFPSRKLKVIGVTGTKGKTSTVHLLYHILNNSGKKVVMLSTISAKFGSKEIDTGLHVTNPSPFALQKLLQKARSEDYSYVVLEVTSHGLEQYRNWGIEFELGIYTQIAADHLIYHGGLQGYRNAKAILAKNSKLIIINQDDQAFKFLKSIAKQNNIKYLIYKGKKDDFQSQNLQAAKTAAKELGIGKSTIKKALESFPGVPGRMEVIQEKPFTVVIDFAHTPESLKAALLKLKKQVRKPGKLIAVFGCAGERDPGRRRMGEIAASQTDLFIITAEDPRTEGFEKISQDIVKYALAKGAKESDSQTLINKYLKQKNQTYFTKIPDRKNAIEYAIQIAQPSDVIGLFGKGHEKSMCYGTKEIPWSERQVARNALKKRKQIKT